MRAGPEFAQRQLIVTNKARIYDAWRFTFGKKTVRKELERSWARVHA